ncbi:uncharacterized protein LOC106131846 [Amyelois transitella]|uniref:uncharacterized protein LOC106131846 n=1 Tax=Amyelois transitella TaxID=680683 RepID=UPI00299027DD|nr:uncharacterized protein LOC106131846 [Amyelois transitella]
MSKRDLQYLKKKLKQLEDQQKRKRRRIFIESSTDTDDNSSRSSTSPTPNNGTPGESAPVLIDELSIPVPENNADADATPELDPDVLTALGEEIEDKSKFGEAIHRNLAQRWEPILKKGLPKEAKEKLMKEYLIPENCTLLQAPKLNREVSAAIAEAARQRDKKKETAQQQLGIGISAINKALTSMLTSDNKVEAIKILSDGCRILTDLHFQETQARISVINYSLAKPFLNVVQDSERDDTLYGNKLGEKIKASKTIEKQGLSIKKFVKTSKSTSNTEHPTPVLRSHYQTKQTGSYQGNWTGSSRYHQNRGGAPRTKQDDCPCDTPVSSATIVEHSGHEQIENNRNSSVNQKSPYPGCRDSLRQAFSSRGAPDSTLDLMLASLAKNTMRQYNVSFKLWWQYCNDNSLDVFDCYVPTVLSFLSSQYYNGASYGSLNNHRSALSLLLGSNIGSDDRIKRLLKGAFKLRPSFPKYSNTWDPQVVLSYISEWKLETLSGAHCTVATNATALVFQTSTVSAALANVGTMHESGQPDPTGSEDKRQP